MNFAPFVLISSIVLMAISCQPEGLGTLEDENEITRDYPGVDQRLWPHFEKFEAAALDRGLRVDLSLANITGEVIPIHENGVAGSCSYGGRQRSKTIEIDSDFWDRASHHYREYIVFHELGHCYLFRDHLEDCLESGIWTSIMRSGTLNKCRDFYNSRTREYYLDELFGTLGD